MFGVFKLFQFSCTTFKTNHNLFAITHTQAIIKNIDEHRDAAKWLVTTLDTLIERTATCESESEQERLDSAVTRYKSLMPVIEITTSKSSLILRCIHYSDAVGERTTWLTAAQLDVPLDSLDTVKMHLQQQEVGLCGHCNRWLMIVISSNDVIHFFSTSILTSFDFSFHLLSSVRLSHPCYPISNYLHLFSLRNSAIGYMCASFQMSTIFSHDLPLSFLSSSQHAQLCTNPPLLLSNCPAFCSVW